MKKDLISVSELSSNDVCRIFNLTDRLKGKKIARSLKNKTLALIFQKPSNRTRVSFEVGMYQLGGNVIYLSPKEIDLGVRESIADVAKTLSRYVDAIVLRTYEHRNVIEMAKSASVPVINGLSDLLHPCQALADLYTIQEKKGRLKGVSVAYIGDGNNVCHSLMVGCAKMGAHIKVASPAGYGPDKDILEEAEILGKITGSKVSVAHSAKDAANSADVIYTDVWASMGKEEEAQKRKEIFRDFQVNKQLASCARKDYIFMHCLPAHRGEEVTDDVLDSKNSVVFDQAENRLHVQKAILLMLLKKGKV
ncbi:MAG: ornithine carbamoyltransferase [Candidatus Omnitrophica bacterium]|nr:ornithine carbamoyltransferase [Candidatus Omnitrophota bacterium]